MERRRGSDETEVRAALYGGADEEEDAPVAGTLAALLARLGVFLLLCVFALGASVIIWAIVEVWELILA